MNRVPCRVSDDPFSDYSEDIKGQGVFVAEDVRMQTDRQTSVPTHIPAREPKSLSKAEGILTPTRTLNGL